MIFQIRAILTMPTFAPALQLLHELLLTEGKRTTYSASTTDEYSGDGEVFDAHEDPALLVERVQRWKNIGPISLKHFRHFVSIEYAEETGLHELHLSCPQRAWMEDKLRRWCDQTDQTEPMGCFFVALRPPPPPDPLDQEYFFRAMHWLFALVDQASQPTLTLTWLDQMAYQETEQLAATAIDCPQCRIRHPLDLCQRILQKIPFPLRPEQDLTLELACGTITAWTSLGRPQFAYQTPHWSGCIAAIEQMESLFPPPTTVVAHAP